MNIASKPNDACIAVSTSSNDSAQPDYRNWFDVFGSLECHKTEIVVKGASQRSSQRSHSSISLQSNRSDSFNGQPPVLDVAYCRAGESYENFLATADEAGNVSILNVGCTPIESPSAALTVHHNAIFRIEWIPATQCAITGSGDSNSSVIDVEIGRILATTSGHRGSVRSLAIRPSSGHSNGHVTFASGARDGAVYLYDTRVGDSESSCPQNSNDAPLPSNSTDRLAPVHALQGAHIRKAERTPTPKRGNKFRKSVPKSSVTSIQFLNESSFVTCGLPDGQIKFWDMRKLPKHDSKDVRPFVVRSIDCSGDQRESASFLHISVTPDGSKLYGTADDNVIYEYSTAVSPATEGTNEWLRAFRGASLKSCYARSSVSPDLQYLASGSGDCCIYLWSLDPAAGSTTQPFKLKGHEEEVAIAAWHASDRYQLASCSSEPSILIWRRREPVAAAANNATRADEVDDKKHDGKWVKDEVKDEEDTLETPKKLTSPLAARIKTENFVWDD